MADARLGHDRDGHGGHDGLDHGGVAHARHAAVRADVRRDALQRHHRACSRTLSDDRLFGGEGSGCMLQGLHRCF